MQGNHNLAIVGLSIAVSFLACFAALGLSGRIRNAATGAIRLPWLVAAALACGGGIWAMHFVAMLGYSIPTVTLRYGILLTLASLIMAIGFCGLGIYLCAKHGTTPKILLGAGALAGMGVATMHYTGMAALDFPGWIDYDPVLFATSIAIAIVAATAALWLCFNMRRLPMRLLSASVMTLAVCGMHYTAMAGATFICRAPSTGAVGVPPPEALALIGTHNLALAVGIAVVLLLLAAILAAAMDESSTKAISALRGKLSSREDLLSSLFQTTPVAILIANEELRIQGFNATAEGVFRIAESDALGRSIESFIPERYRAAHRTATERFARGDASTLVMESRMEIFGLRADGEEFPAKISLAKTRAAEGLLFTIVLQDITREKAAADELKAAKDTAEAAAIEKSRFLANISHEVRTPLNGIVGMIQILEASAANSDDAECFKLMKASAAQLLGLFNDIFDLVRLDSHALRVNIADFDPAGLVAETVADHAAQAKTRGLELLLVDPGAGIPPCRADKVRARQILSNLIGNAVKFTDFGTVRVAVSAAEGEICYSVGDTGPGIAPEHLQRVFERFFQVDDSSTRSREGAGLGLAICRELAARMGGRLEAQSVVGEGSTFTLYLPAAGASRSRVANAA